MGRKMYGKRWSGGLCECHALVGARKYRYAPTRIKYVGFHMKKEPGQEMSPCCARASFLNKPAQAYPICKTHAWPRQVGWYLWEAWHRKTSYHIITRRIYHKMVFLFLFLSQTLCPMNYKGTAEVRISYTYPFNTEKRASMKGRFPQSGEAVP